MKQGIFIRAEAKGTTGWSRVGCREALRLYPVDSFHSTAFARGRTNPVVSEMEHRRQQTSL